jgi:hypothetical protein
MFSGKLTTQFRVVQFIIRVSLASHQHNTYVLLFPSLSDHGLRISRVSVRFNRSG